MILNGINKPRPTSAYGRLHITKSLKIPKGAIRICISKDKQHNGQQKKYKRTNNDQQNKTYT